MLIWIEKTFVRLLPEVCDVWWSISPNLIFARCVCFASPVFCLKKRACQVHIYLVPGLSFVTGTAPFQRITNTSPLFIRKLCTQFNDAGIPPTWSLGASFWVFFVVVVVWLLTLLSMSLLFLFFLRLWLRVECWVFWCGCCACSCWVVYLLLLLLLLWLFLWRVECFVVAVEVVVVGSCFFLFVWWWNTSRSFLDTPSYPKRTEHTAVYPL